MDFLFDLGRELLFVTAAAACLEMILPESTIRRPLRFIFGLWFLALLLNPLISLISDTDLNEIARSFGEYDELPIVAEIDAAAGEQVYREAGERLSAEIEAGLKAVFGDEDFDVETEIDAKGVVSLRVRTAAAEERKKEMLRFLAERYGINKEKIEILNGEGERIEGSFDASYRRG